MDEQKQCAERDAKEAEIQRLWNERIKAGVLINDLHQPAFQTGKNL